MIIIHSVIEKKFKECNKWYGQESLDRCGFIHCSQIHTYGLVAPNFKDEKDKRVLLVIDTNKLVNKVKFEDGGEGTKFPHIYGLLNLDAVIEILPHLWSNQKEWIMNEELNKYIK